MEGFGEGYDRVTAREEAACSRDHERREGGICWEGIMKDGKHFQRRGFGIDNHCEEPDIGVMDGDWASDLKGSTKDT